MKEIIILPHEDSDVMLGAYYDHKTGIIHLLTGNIISLNHEIMHKLLYEECIDDSDPEMLSRMWDNVCYDIERFIFSELFLEEYCRLQDYIDG